MSARRAVLLTLLSVFVVAILAASSILAFWSYRRYQRADARAERWMERAQVLEQDATVAYDRGYRDGEAEGKNAPWTGIGIDDAGWYIIRVRAPNGALRFEGAESMQPCRHYWIYSWEYDDAGTVGRSIDEPC